MFTEWLTTVAIGVLVFILVHYYQFLRELRRYPPGPTPIPLLGNLLSFTSKQGALPTIGKYYYEKYGDVFTLWFGNKPHIVVSDWELVKDILARNDLNHRPPSLINELVYEDKFDVVLGNPSPKWHLLKKTIAGASRNYVASKKLEAVVQETIEDLVNENLGKESFDGPKFALSSLINVMAVATFGSQNPSKMAEAVDILVKSLNVFHDEAGNGFPSDFLPLLRPFFRSNEKRLKTCVVDSQLFVKEVYNEHRATFNREDIRDFIDAILAAKEDIKEEDDFINEDFVAFIVLNLFMAGTDTTATSLSWTLLYLAKYPEFQERIKEELKDKIGDRMATQDDSKRCHYTMAFFNELFRMQAIAPFLLPHYTECDTTIGSHNIPAGSSILCNMIPIQKNGVYWEEPTKFKPERFLDKDGTLTVSRPGYYCPFGLGVRACIGEKFAKMNLFLGTVALLQRCQILLVSPDTDDILQPDAKAILTMPKPFQIKFLPKT